MGKELSLGLRIVVIGSMVLTACSKALPAVEATSTKRSSETPTHTFTPTPSETPTPSPTSTEIPTPTPDWRQINAFEIDSALEGESITLRGVTFDRVIVVHPPFIKDLVFGAITDDEGKTETLIENFDCQYKSLRDDGQLGEKKEVGDFFLPAEYWDISGSEFDSVEATKNSNLGEVEVIQSESFVRHGQKTVCPEVPVGQPATDFTKRVSAQAKELVMKIIERFSAEKPVATPTP